MSQEDELSDSRGTVTRVQGGSLASASGPDQGGSTGPSSGQGPGPSSTRGGGSTEQPVDALLQLEPPDKEKEVVVDSGVTPSPGSASKRKRIAYFKAQYSDTARKQVRETVPEVPPVPDAPDAPDKQETRELRRVIYHLIPKNHQTLKEVIH
jgi:hypothetical protein